MDLEMPNIVLRNVSKRDIENKLYWLGERLKDEGNRLFVRHIRRKALELYGNICMKCGGDTDIHVDHIKPRSLYPALMFDLDNLQILCKKCNFNKGNKDFTNYRKQPKETI